MNRAWAMPSHKTFTIKPIKELINKYGSYYLDPFPYPFKEDAIDYLKGVETGSCDMAVFDPPYSQRQLREMYDSNGLAFNHPMNSSYWRNCKDEISRTLNLNSICISFGWNSGGMGKSRGFEIIEILLIAHGGQHNDTICTVERKIKNLNR